MANDFGYEPWARAAVLRGEKLTPEQGSELLNSLDEARRHAELAAMLRVELRDRTEQLVEAQAAIEVVRAYARQALSGLTHFSPRSVLKLLGEPVED